MPERNVTQVFTAPRAQDGDGVDLRRAFPGATIADIDPFLLLDQMGPTEFAPGDARGFPPHPHLPMCLLVRLQRGCVSVRRERHLLRSRNHLELGNRHNSNMQLLHRLLLSQRRQRHFRA